MPSETTALFRRYEQLLLKLQKQVDKLQAGAGRALQNSNAGGGTYGSALTLKFATTTGTGIPAASSASVNEETAAGVATGNTFSADNRHPTSAVGNTKKIICINDGSTSWVVWEAC